jgi:cell division septum initiation protein DivIVA
MKLKKLKKKIQELEKRLREGPGKLASLKRKVQQAESAKALKAARKSAARATASAGKKSWEPTTGAQKPSSAKKAKRKLNLSPERRAQLAAAMKARWAAKRAAEGNSTTSSDQNFPTPPTKPPENRADGF